jgi:hypothetical protein
MQGVVGVDFLRAVANGVVLILSVYYMLFARLFARNLFKKTSGRDHLATK